MNCLLVDNQHHWYLHKPIKNGYNRDMKSNRIFVTRHKWVLAWIVQAVIATAVSLAASLMEAGPHWLSMAMLWLAVPLAGGWTAMTAVKKGLSNYLAWLAPPAALYIVHLAVWGYAPPVLPTLFCALASMVGAAAGEVGQKRSK